jgi:hypothetical protein
MPDIKLPLPGKSLKVEEPPKKSEKQELLEKIGATLREYEMESNVPYTHEYWGWKNQLRVL